MAAIQCFPSARLLRGSGEAAWWMLAYLRPTTGAFGVMAMKLAPPRAVQAAGVRTGKGSGWAWLSLEVLPHAGPGC